jgi:hypothetical protein
VLSSKDEKEPVKKRRMKSRKEKIYWNDEIDGWCVEVSE